MKLSNAEWLVWPETKVLLRAFGNNPVRFVGGAVRDSLLEIKVQDVDAATTLLPEQVISLLARADIKAIPTGIDHGTVTAVIGKHHFEITTLRRDVTTDGRRAVVAYTDDWREDAARRDFTMNALYADPEGNITDYFNGVEDARAGRVRFIGKAEDRICEDALRILRFFRFVSFYGKLPADKQALAACTANAAKMDGLSGERIQQEMLKLLTAENCAAVIDLMQETRVLPYVIPRTVSTGSLKKLPEIMHTLKYASDPILALSLLLRSTHTDFSLLGMIRWKLSKVHYYRLSDLHKTSKAAGRKEGGEKLWKQQIRQLGKDMFISQVIINMAEGHNMETGFKAIELASGWQIPEFPVNGEDLISHGIKPGKDMGTLLRKLEAYWEENDYVPGKQELLKNIAS